LPRPWSSQGGLDLDHIIDRGTGIDDALEHKRGVVASAVATHGPFADPKHIMRAVGELELATMTGFILGLSGNRLGCMLDEFPVTSAANVPYLIDTSCVDYLLAGHLSKAKGRRIVLDAMGLSPLISLDMRLGEGKGAVIGGFVVQLAARV